MSNIPRDDLTTLAHLTDALVEDILETSDEELLSEMINQGDDPAKLASELRALFESTVLEVRKAKLVAAKEAVTASRRQAAVVVKLDPAEARRRYESRIAEDTELSQKLTVAARKGRGQSERDIESAIEDLAELGAFDDEDDEI